MFRYVVSSLVVLALAVWIGALVFFGAAVAPVVFDPQLIPSRTLSGAVNAAILVRMSLIETVAAIIVVGGSVYGVYRTGSWLSWGVLVLAVGMAGTSYYYNNVLFPRLDDLRIGIGSFDFVAAEKIPLREEFSRLHRTYSLLVRLVLGAGIVALVLHSSSLVRFRMRTQHLRWLAETGPFKDHIDAGDEPTDATATDTDRSARSVASNGGG